MLLLLMLLRNPLLLSLSTLTCGSHAALQDTHCKLSLIVLAVVGVAIAALLRSVQLCSVCSNRSPPKSCSHLDMVYVLALLSSPLCTDKQGWMQAFYLCLVS